MERTARTATCLLAPPHARTSPPPRNSRLILARPWPRRGSRTRPTGGPEARLVAIRQSERDLATVVRMTADFARTGQGRQGDGDRAATEAMLLRTQVQNAEEEVAATSAELARLLSRDPSVRLRVAEE